MSVVTKDNGLIEYFNQPVIIKDKITEAGYSSIYPRIEDKHISYNKNTLHLSDYKVGAMEFKVNFDTHIEIDSDNMQDALNEIKDRLRPDGRKFSEVNISLSIGQNIRKVIYTHEQYFVLISDNNNLSSKIMHSTDGVLFTDYATISGKYFMDMCVVKGAIALVGVESYSDTQYRTIVCITQDEDGNLFQKPAIDFSRLYIADIGSSPVVYDKSIAFLPSSEAKVVQSGLLLGVSIALYNNNGYDYDRYSGTFKYAKLNFTGISEFGGLNNSPDGYYSFNSIGTNTFVVIVGNHIGGIINGTQVNWTYIPFNRTIYNKEGAIKISHYDPINDFCYFYFSYTLGLYQIFIDRNYISFAEVYEFTNNRSQAYFDIQYIHGKYIYNIADASVDTASCSYGLSPFGNIPYYSGRVIMNQALKNISYYNNMIYGIGSSDGKLYYSQTI